MRLKVTRLVDVIVDIAEIGDLGAYGAETMARQLASMATYAPVETNHGRAWPVDGQLYIEVVSDDATMDLPHSSRVMR